LLQIPDVGQVYHFPGTGSPTSAIGIAIAQSYRLVGVSEVPTAIDVTEVRDTLERVQLLTVTLSALNEQIGRLRSELERVAKTSTEGKTEKLGPQEYQTTASKALVWNMTNELTRLDQDRRNTFLNLSNAQVALRTAANKPGIVIAEWKMKEDLKASTSAGSVGRVSLGVGDGKRGFVVLGGIRFVSLVYGEDFWWFLNNLRPHEKTYIREFGLATYLIQTHHVAYVTAIHSSREASVTASYLGRSSSKSDSFEVEAAYAQLAQSANSGNLGSITWRREPYCFVCGIDLPELTTNKSDRVVQQGFGVADAWSSGPSYQGWRTIAANITYPGFAFKAARPWEKYKQENATRGAPLCPNCGGRVHIISGIRESNTTRRRESGLSKQTP